jgi:hypothetical protein
LQCYCFKLFGISLLSSLKILRGRAGGCVGVGVCRCGCLYWTGHIWISR